MFRLTTRRSLWAPALVVAGAAVGIASMVGITAALRTWPLWVVAFGAFIAAVAWVDRRLHPDVNAPTPEVEVEPEPGPERRRGKAAPGGAPSAGYDLEGDRSTDKQRFLM
jgi:hypothetical protein